MPGSSDMDKGLMVYATSLNQYFYKGRMSSYFCTSTGLNVSGVS